MCDNENVLNNSWNELMTQDEIYDIVCLKEMIHVRNGHQVCLAFTKDEINMFIELLCVKNFNLFFINFHVLCKFFFTIVLFLKTKPCE